MDAINIKKDTIKIFGAVSIFNLHIKMPDLLAYVALGACMGQAFA